ncbi:hypothetical protein ACWWJF_23605 [Symbiopectobacterium sp. Eva_TO]
MMLAIFQRLSDFAPIANTLPTSHTSIAHFLVYRPINNFFYTCCAAREHLASNEKTP